MHIHYLQTRQELGFNCLKDINAVKQLSDLKNFVKITRSVSVAYIVKSKQICILIFSKEALVAVLIFVQSMYVNIDLDVSCPSFINSPEVYQCRISKSDNLEFKESLRPPSPVLDSILTLKGGSDELTIEEQERLVKSVLSKLPESGYQEISINKFLKKILNQLEPILTNKNLWRILSELEKKPKWDTIQSTSIVSPRGLNEIGDLPNDFESRLKQQELSNARDLKLLREHAKVTGHRDKFNRLLHFLNPRPRRDIKLNLSRSGLPHKKTMSAIKLEKVGSNINDLKLSSPKFPMRKQIIVSAAPGMSESNSVPTSQMFNADPVTGIIQDINIAFDHFETRMTEIGNQYTGAKRDNFFKYLDECSIDRFKALSTENGLLTIYGVREAETMLQSEFDGYHEPNSITRMTEAESAAGNKLDGRFRKGLLSGQLNTLNKNFTDLDAKVLVSDKTLQYQANQRRILGHRNPNPVSMYQQGKESGYSIILQKSKHCDSSIVELPSSAENVNHIVNTIELSLEETAVAKAGLIEGARKGLSEQLNVAKESISDETALEGILFLNQDYTIERIN